MTRVVIIGGGPGGYEAALVGAQLGASVTVVDRDGLGGAAVLTDVVPSKTLIAAAEILTRAVEGARLGLQFDAEDTSYARVGVDVPKLNARIRDLAAKQSDDIAERLRAEGISVIVDAAVKAARRAFTKWSRLSGAERAKYLYRIARIMQERAREFAVLETLNNGKPIKETRDFDIPMAAAWFFHYAGWADKLEYAGFGPNPRPIGVAGQVIPWNFPLMMLAWKIADRKSTRLNSSHT